MEKRLIIAIALSVMVMLIFQKFIQPPSTSQGRFISPQASMPSSESTIAIEPADIYKEKEDTVKKAIKEVYYTHETEKFLLTFTNIGGALKGIKLKEYDTGIIENVEAPYSIFSLVSAKIEPNLAISNYDYSFEENKITYIFNKAGADISIKKEFIFYKANDYIELNLIIENKSDKNIDFDYSIIGPSKLEQASTIKGRNVIEMDAMVDGRLFRKTGIRGDQQVINGIISWIALKNNYFTVAMNSSNAAEALIIRQSKGRLTTGLKIKTRNIAPRSYIQDRYKLYMGPIIKERLTAANIGIENMINVGFVGNISAFLLTLLKIIHAAVNNWGVAIIVVTILINIVLFPLTMKSFRSMSNMQQLQPHMEKLRNIHKDNPQKLNKEMAELYKKFNVNPFGGCIPMLLQMPIFIAFYQTLLKSIELKNAHFLWIKDLSSPDALIKFLKPVPLLGEQFNLLPIVTVIVMFIQQQMSTSQSSASASSELAKQQKLMSYFFPLFFGMILYNFPSGLVLYWLTNSALMTCEQFIMRRHKA